MNARDIITRVQSLQLPAQSFIVFGSCPLALAGLREANDIDLLVSEDIFTMLRDSGWQQIDKGLHDKPLAWEDFEAHQAWDFTSYKPTLKHLLESADIVDGVPFASLDEVRKWKLASGRPKDIKDIELIDKAVVN